MKYLRYSILLLAVFPWVNFVFRNIFPSFIGSIWDDLFLLTIVILLWIYKREEPRYLYIPSQIYKPFYVFIFFCAAAIIVHFVPLKVSVDVLRVVFQPMLFALLTMYLMDDGEILQRFMYVLIVSTVLIALLGIFEYMFRLDFWKNTGKEQFRIVSIFNNPNALASYFNMVLSFTVASILQFKDKRYKLINILISSVILVALLLTFSRSAWIAFVVMLLYYIFIWNKKWLAVVPPVIALSIFVLPSSIINRFGNLFDPAYYQMSSEYGRLNFWSVALEKMLDNPIFGVGLGMFGDSVPLRHNIPFSTWVDNHFLKLGAEIGIIGLLGFMVLMLMLFRLAHKMVLSAETQKEKIILMGIGGVIITMTVQNVTASIFEALVNAIYFYSFIGILFALVYKRNKEG